MWPPGFTGHEGDGIGFGNHPVPTMLDGGQITEPDPSKNGGALDVAQLGDF
jgi:hypothetical protein